MGHNPMPNRRLSVLFLANAVFTFVGGLALLFLPEKVMYGVHIDRQYYFLFYLLGASAFSLAVVSFFARGFREKESIRAAVCTFLAFHGITALVGVYSMFMGASTFISVNAAVHAIFFVLFLVFGFSAVKMRK